MFREKQDSEFALLFNGKNLQGWYTFLREKGKDHDPENIFQVTEEGELQISGKEFGYISTIEEFENYHFTLEFKWGTKKHPPRENDKRDSGICYHFPKESKDEVWPKSVECQIQEGDCGDFWLIGGATIVLI